MTSKWKLNRAGLFNFWYYDNEVFDFEDGKLLLRGTNGSGKSVTMQSLLPVLLDGKKSPDRLDPFGSRSRRMADYLLGEKEVSDREERTGYLYLEYKREDAEQYMTTGMGMQAKRNQPLKSWGFVITDNRRIGRELELYKLVNQNGEKKQFPLSQTELITVIGSGGEVASSNQEYMRLVNRYVFGFESMEAYDDLIKLLIQLRSPKLSKDFKPTVIYEILEEALPPLTDEDLRYLSDSIEQMDQTKQQMEQLEREVKALTRLKDAYEAYSERILADQVKEWKQAEGRVKRETEELEVLRQRRLSADAELEQSRRREREQDIRKKALEEQRRRLQSHEVFQLEEELQRKQQEQREVQRERNQFDQRLAGKVRKERETGRRLEDLEERISAKERELQDAIADLDYEAETSGFAQHQWNVQDYERHAGGPFNFDNWKRELEAHIVKLESVLEELRRRDQVIEQFQERDRELSEVKQAHDELLLQERKWRQMLSDEKQALIHRIHLWAEQHERYSVTDTVMQQMARWVDELYEGHDEEEVRGLFSPFIHAYEDGVRTTRAQTEMELQQARQERDELHTEWKQWQAKRDPEPERHQATQEARAQLATQGVACKPLYEVVEFRPGIPSEVQLRLESALMDTGLLDALVAASDVAFRHDRVLTAEPKLFAATLADYLQPDVEQKTISYERIEAVLQSIEMDGQAPVHFTEDGRYRIGSLRGHALPRDEVRFIGREARRRYREQLLAELEAQIEASEQGMLALEEACGRLDEQLRLSKEAWQQFPSARDVKACQDELAKVMNAIRGEEARISRISEQLARLDQQLQESKRRLNLLAQGLGLQWQTDALQEAVTMSRQYEKRLNEIHREHAWWMKLLEDERRERDLLKELREETDEMRGELAVLEDKLAKLNQEIIHIQQQQQLKGAEDVRREISKVNRELGETSEEWNDLVKTIPRLEVELRTLDDKLKEKESLRTFWEKMRDAWEEAVRKEWQRGMLAANRIELDDSLVQELASKKLTKERSVLEGQVTSLFYSLQADLTEHKMSQYTDAQTVPEWMATVEREEWKPIVEQWRTRTIRNVIEFDQRGVKISPAALYETVSRELSVQETRLDEMDKQLYEEILLNAIGHKLRARIRRAEQWTEKMRGLMESRDTSSGLKFSIRWKPRTAESEQELDTSDLVSLLKQDAKLLTDADLERITRHFRSKIQAAKNWLEEKGEGQSLLQVLKMVLDYRKWFSFVLYYERPNEPRRELTNHHFFKFSGGEKAMAMYIPLFTACYSRYQEAAPSAPYVISLDEAFAGVDENNINEMFEIVEQLGFNYIMNSQVLWGDYETVQSLSVCELVRPKNADYVTVIRYQWNGRELSLAGIEDVVPMEDEERDI